MNSYIVPGYALCLVEVFEEIDQNTRKLVGSYEMRVEGVYQDPGDPQLLLVLADRVAEL